MDRDIIASLDEYRLEHRITQERLAGMLGVTFQTVNRWFNQRNRPSKMQEYQIRKLLKIKRKTSR